MQSECNSSAPRPRQTRILFFSIASSGLIAFLKFHGDDVRGKARTPQVKADDLAYIFFNIRTSRDTATRRSWQRRAREALAKVAHLTDAERHEVAAVWSKPNCNHIDSPALRKLQGRTDGAHEWETVSAKRFTRRATGAKKPGITRHAEASNDGAFNCLQLVFSFGT